MKNQLPWAVRLALLGTVLLSVGLSSVGVTWGLPSRRIDPYLFADMEPWSGEKIHRLANAAGKFSPQRGADVDADPIREPGDGPVRLTATEEDVAKIFLRYRLYTHQPDEMITMMALAGMRPGQFDFDPRLYQYGGLFIYPVGALIKLCGLFGLIDVRGDIVFYLDNPGEFAKFYIVARAYSAAWGALGVVIVFAIARRLGGDRAGLLAALLFALLPVVACMSHEGKPHLPGAVLMLAAVYFAMRFLENKPDAPALPPVDEGGTEGQEGSRECRGVSRMSWLGLCLCCGAALGMVLSSWPVFVLIPLVARMRPRPIIEGTAVAVGAYCLANPYVVINAIWNREVLRSNFGNSLAMYEVSRIGEGFLRVGELTLEGATLPVVVLGVIALALGAWRRNREMVPLALPAAVFFLQFVLIGAGKPAEYGRFGIFYETALAIGAACCLMAQRRFRRDVGFVCTLAAVLWVSWFHAGYLRNFLADAQGGSRIAAAMWERALFGPESLGPKNAGEYPYNEFKGRTVAVVSEPAPYCCPPLPFAQIQLQLERPALRSRASSESSATAASLIRVVDHTTAPRPGLISERSWNSSDILRHPWTLLRFLPRATPISWANKPIELTVEGKTYSIPN